MKKVHEHANGPFSVPDGCEVPSLFLRGGISPPSIPGGGVILLRVCGPVFLNLPQSYTLSSKKKKYSFT